MKLLSRPSIRVKILFFLLPILHACGYQKTEEDKFPDLPLLSDASNDQFQVTPFGGEDVSIEGTYHNLLYVTEWVTDGDTKKMFSAYDPSLTKVASFPISRSNIYFDHLGTIYLLKSDSIFKHSYPSFRRERIKPLPFNGEKIFDEMYDSIQRMAVKDPYFSSNRFVSGELTKLITKFNSKKQKIQYLLVGDVVILFIGKETYWTTEEYLDKSGMERWGNDAEEEYADEPEQSGKLIVFDHAKLENKSSGNHFAFGYYQSGLEYFKLVLAKDTLQFKYPSKFLNERSVTVFPNFGTDRLVLLKSETDDWYILKHL